MHAQRVTEVMTADLIVLQSNDSARDAAIRMREAGIGAVIVAEGDTVKGIVTDRDIVVRCVAENGDCSRTRLSQICSRDRLATLSPEDDVDQAVALMRERAVRRLPVVDHGKPVGILSLGDLAMARDPYSVLADISHTPPNE